MTGVPEPGTDLRTSVQRPAPSYCRSKNGKAIHANPGCRFSQGSNVVPWLWAAGKFVDEIIAGILADGGPGLLRQYSFCYFCFGRMPNMDIQVALGELGWGRCRDRTCEWVNVPNHFHPADA